MYQNPNQHVVQYLDQFLAREANFALMISGEWGTGKTFLVNSHLGMRKDSLYVSLNGTAKVSDVIERLYLAAFPIFSDKTVKALGSIGRSIAGAFRIKTDLKVNDLFDIDKYNIIIFDDIERSLICPVELLGFINNFVEHDTKHVILIANEIELNKKLNYKEIREKVIGFTLDVRADFESAIVHFRSKFSESYQIFLKSSHEELLRVLREAGLKNVRVTKYVLSEFEEVYAQISSSKINAEEMRAMFLSFFVLNYAYKTGAIVREDIRKRNTNDFTRLFLSNRDDHEPDDLEKLNRSHANVDVYTSSFDSEYLEEKICDGFHDCDKLARTLGDLSAKSDSKQNPEWRNLWYLIHQEDEVVTESFERMMQNFTARSYDDPGVILHVFGLLHRMRDAGLLKWTTNRITRECKKYISDLFVSKTLPLFGDDFISGYRHGSAHGLGFTSIGEPSFIEAMNFYRVKSEELKDILILEEIKTIVEDEDFKVDAFRALILQGAREDNVYSRPIMHLTDPAKLADSVINAPAEKQFEILIAIGSRYNQSPYPDVRTTEATWLRKFIKALRSAAKRESKVTKFRIEEAIKWSSVEPTT